MVFKGMFTSLYIRLWTLYDLLVNSCVCDMGTSYFRCGCFLHVHVNLGARFFFFFLHLSLSTVKSKTNKTSQRRHLENVNPRPPGVH